jgi:hypothetical protein
LRDRQLRWLADIADAAIHRHLLHPGTKIFSSLFLTGSAPVALSSNKPGLAARISPPRQAEGIFRLTFGE